MTEEDDLLAQELGKLGSNGGKLSAAISGGPSGLAGLGGQIGASLAARFLPTERYQVELHLSTDPRVVLSRTYSFLSNQGRVTNASELRNSPFPTVSGVVGSGFFNMNPAVLYAEITEFDGQRCTVLLTGAAKEGLIKQNTSRKAVDRLAATLRA